MYKQRIDMINISQKCDVESSRQDQIQLDGAPESRKLFLTFNFLFWCLYSVVNFMGNYFWDLALFLFEQKVKRNLYIVYIVFALPYFSAGTSDIAPDIT